MKEKYYFRFLLNHITLQNHIQQDLAADAQFQIEIYKDKKLIGQTSNTYSKLDQNGQIALQNEVIKFTTFFQENDKNLNICQIRLLQIYPGGDRLIGSYQFALSNYIRAKKQLNRSCIEMVIQIAQSFKIDYAVYLETTLEALAKIIQQHQTARKLQIFQEDYEQPSFLPEQIGKPQFQDNEKKIVYDLQSPLIIHQRYWSPNRAQRLAQKSQQFKQQSQVETQEDKKSSSGSKLRHMTKKYSTLSDNSNNQIMRRQFSQKQKQISNIMQQQVDCLMQDQNADLGYKELYQVISSDSKITYSPITEDHNASEDRTNFQANPLKNQNDNYWQSLVNKIGLKTIIMSIIFIALLSFTVYDHMKKGSRRKKGTTGQKFSKKSHKL